MRHLKRQSRALTLIEAGFHGRMQDKQREVGVFKKLSYKIKVTLLREEKENPVPLGIGFVI